MRGTSIRGGGGQGTGQATGKTVGQAVGQGTGQATVQATGTRPANRAARRREQREQQARAKSARRGLGRGLDSLIPGSGPAGSAGPNAGLGAGLSAGAGGGPLRAPIGAITPNPSQPRKEFDPERLAELAASIGEHGMLQPLLVQPERMGRYELIAGERRWRAAGLAGLATVPIVIREGASAGADGPADPGGAAERLTLALVENLQRADLNPIETAAAFERLAESGWTQERIAREVGKSRAAVTNLLRLRRLPVEVQERIASGALSEGHGRALMVAPESEWGGLAARAAAGGWTVRQLEQAAQRLQESEEAAGSSGPGVRGTPGASPAMLDAVARLESALGTRVEVRAGSTGPSGGGRIVVHWYDEEQLSTLAAQMAGLFPDEGVDAEEFGI